MTTFYSSRFIEAGSAVNLESHTPNTGSALVKLYGTSASVLGSSAGYADFATDAGYITSAALTTADGSVTVIMSGRGGSSNTLNVAIRFQPDNETYYFGIDALSCSCKYDNGSLTTLQTGAGTTDADTTEHTYVITFTGSAFTFTKDGSSLMTIPADSSLSAAGKVFLSLANARLHDLIIEDSASGGGSSNVRRKLLLGVG